MLDRWIALVEKSGIWEMYVVCVRVCLCAPCTAPLTSRWARCTTRYNPLTGAPYGAVGLGMSTLIVDWLYRLGRV